jgi:hypothetical protein
MKGIVFDAPQVVEISGPLIFLAGPIQGAPLWHDEAISLIQKMDDSIHIASPCRRKLKRLTALVERLTAHLSQEFTDEMYNEQVDWETHYLNRCAEDGVVLFWLAKEHRHICTRAYAQTTRFELGEWKERSKWTKTRLVVGIEKGFTNERYLRRRLTQDCPTVPILDTLESTCSSAIKLVRGTLF